MKVFPILPVIWLFPVIVTGAVRLPVIDMHLHVETEIWAEHRLCFPQPCEGPPTAENIMETLAERTVAEMDKNNIVLGLLSEYDFDKVLAWDSRFPDRFMPGCCIGHPNKTDWKRLEEELKSGRLKIMGEITSQYFDVAIDDPSLDIAFALAEKYNVPVFVHVEGIGGDPQFPINLGNPLRLTTVMRKHPDLRLWMENAGFPFLEEAISLMYQYPNVYADLSTITWIIPDAMFQKYLKGLMEAGLGKRLMFGSDQMLWPETISLAVAAIEEAEFLTKQEKRDILYNNAARFLRLGDGQIKAHHEKTSAPPNSR